MKSLLATLIIACFAFTACGQPSTVEFNNIIVTDTEAASQAIEESALLYNELVPSKVTEQDEIETRDLSRVLRSIERELKAVESLMNLEGKNLEQDSAVDKELQNYLEASQSYVSAYSEMLSYYEEELYKEDITKVQEYDENLKASYDLFLEANTALKETLSKFIN